MATSIAANAWIDPRAEIDEEVEIGPFCTVGPEVKIGRGTRLLNNVTLMGKVTLGVENVLYPNVVIGGEPQDVSYQGGETRVDVRSKSRVGGSDLGANAARVREFFERLDEATS